MSAETPRHFTRRQEDFTCSHCGAKVGGTGYTDHCPKCLWGMHSDINPGDRASQCRGATMPVSTSCDRDGTYTITYVCLKCGIRKHFKQAANDAEAVLVRLLDAKF